LPGLIGIAVLLGTAGELNLFLLGEDQAASTGMRTAGTRQVLLAISAVVIAAGVCVTGVIGFVGLVVPHLARLVLGPDHRVLLPVSVLVGGVFLVLADVIARNLFDRSEEHTSELQSRENLVCRLLLEKKNSKYTT